MNFAEKNNFVLNHTDGKQFFTDLELFKKHFPNDRLNNDLARANTITYHRLDGTILLRLLDKIPPDEILANRQPPAPAEEETPPVAPAATAEEDETPADAKKKDKNKKNSLS
jgi:hypothetical protein